MRQHSVRWARILGATAAGLALAVGAPAAQEAPPDPFAAIKHVALAGGGSVWVGFGGQARVRYEQWDGFNFAAKPDSADGGFGLLRFRLSADLHVGSSVRVFAEGKSAVVPERPLAGGRRTSDMDQLDVQQLWADVTLPAVAGTAPSLRMGRQDLAFGAERLVGGSDWTNTRRTFEGLTVRAARGGWALTGLLVRPVAVKKVRVNRGDTTATLYGAYLANPRLTPTLSLDVYWLGLNRQSVTFNCWSLPNACTRGVEERQTIGARLAGRLAGTALDIELEAAQQFGTVGANDIRAWMGTAVLGWTVPRLPQSPRVYAEVDYASGDRRQGGDTGTFFSPYPTAHSFLGYADVIGRANVVGLVGGASVRLGTGTLSMDAHRFLRASRADGMYGTAGQVVRQPGIGAARHLGDEIDVLFRYPHGTSFVWLAGFSHYFPGQFVEQTGASTATSLLYTSLQFTL